MTEEVVEVVEERDNLIQTQEAVIDQAKTNLKEDGFLEPMASFSAISDGKGQLADVPAGEKTVIFNPLRDVMGGNPTVMLERFIDLVVENPDQVIPLVKSARNAAPPHIEDPDAYILSMLLSKAGMHEKDITSLHIRDLIDRLNAYAIVMVHEAWMKKDVDPEDAGKSIAKDPDAEECILATLETRGWQRSVQIPFTRVESESEEGDAIEEIEFQEPIVIDSEEEEENSLVGRFFGFFDHTDQEQS